MYVAHRATQGFKAPKRFEAFRGAAVVLCGAADCLLRILFTVLQY